MIGCYFYAHKAACTAETGGLTSPPFLVFTSEVNYFERGYMMNDLTVIGATLPANIEDAAKFAIFAQEKLKSVRAEISAIKRLGLAKEVWEQKKREAQELAELATDAFIKVGEFASTVPKASGGDRGNQYTGGKSTPRDTFAKTKEKTLQDMGFSKNQISQAQKLARHPEIVEQAKVEARERDDIVSRSFVLQKINEAAKPHIAHNSGNNEWYTPAEYIEAARQVMGEIDLDPASSDIANEVVKAMAYYTINDNGLSKDWQGRIWLNPPYAGELISQFINKLSECYRAKRIEEAIVLVNNATETTWFNELVQISSAVVFPKSRVKFYTPDGKTGVPLQGQAVLYCGKTPDIFMAVFGHFGWGAYT